MECLAKSAGVPAERPAKVARGNPHILANLLARTWARVVEKMAHPTGVQIYGLLWPLAVVLLGATAVARSQDLPLDTFRQEVLRARFDTDADGKLNEREKRALRDAFGGIDVPALPPEPFDYETTRLPGHIDRRELEIADNTPPDNAVRNPVATLGRVLFYDTQVSRSNTVSCASCHPQAAAFSDPRQFSVGFRGGQTGRNSMGLANLRYNIKGARPGLFWDERVATLEAQTLLPIQDEVEMGMDLAELEVRLAKLPYYPPLFLSAFGTPQVTRERIGQALAQFLRCLVAFDAKFDRAADRAGSSDYSKPFSEFTAEENLGKSLFIDGRTGVAELGCAHCHVPPTFGMPKSFNNGLDLKYKDRGLGALNRPPNDPFTPSNDGKFKAPSLRNIVLTAPYMHDGRFQTLEQVVEHYSSGIQPHENVGIAFEERDTSKPTFGFGFSPDEKAALVAFMKTLTDERLIADPRFADPFVRLAGTAAADSAAERYQRLIGEYDDGAEPRDLAGRFFALADEFPKDPVAVDALVWVLSKLRNRPEAVRAIEQLEKNHLCSERLAAACAQIARVPALAAERCLRAALQKSPHRTVRAQACLQLATMLEQHAAVVQQLKKDPSSADRVLQYYGKEVGSHLAALDPAKLSGELERVYDDMQRSFADVTAGDGTMGELAAKSLFRIRHLSIGRVAPDIEAEDIDGVRFKLSDYRGRVVVLSFWGDW